LARGACIDIGSNTTRLLVADRFEDRLEPIHEHRAFTHIGRDVRTAGRLTEGKIREVCEVVSDQLARARELGAEQIAGVATAAIRQAENGSELVEQLRAGCGIEIEILSEEEEARLAFAGAARTLDQVPDGDLAVVDVGGGSSELVVGTFPDQVSWFASFGLGSSDLAHAFLHSDPPSADEISDARRQVASVFAGLTAPESAEAVAVGGSATSLCRLAGALLDADAFARSLALLAERSAHEVAHLFGLEIERVRLLPAGLLILRAASECLGLPLRVANGGLREGVLLERCRA
jgi:exopolyphosphatase / guanosine-5'-triphosphate,3'-diphosphate pyrophosphatase